MDAEQTPVDETKVTDAVEADGYYGEDADDEELDLSFLDEEEDDVEKADTGGSTSDQSK